MLPLIFVEIFAVCLCIMWPGVFLYRLLNEFLMVFPMEIHRNAENSIRDRQTIIRTTVEATKTNTTEIFLFCVAFAKLSSMYNRTAKRQVNDENEFESHEQLKHEK